MGNVATARSLIITRKQCTTRDGQDYQFSWSWRSR